MRHCISALFLTLITVGGSAYMTNAADLNLDPDVTPFYSTDTWTGGYLGVHGGKAWSKGGVELGKHSGVLIPLDVQNGLFVEDKKDLRGTITGGVTAGYNYEINNQFVVGIEGDVSLLSLSVKHTRSRIDPNPNPPFTGLETNSEYKTEFDTFGTVRLRAGVNLGKTLIYLTAGLAAGEVKNSFGISIPGLVYESPDWSKSGFLYGYAVGAGIEHKINSRMSVKAEGLMVDLEDRVVNGRDPVNFPGEHISYKFDNNLIVGRVGINYAF